MHYATANLLVRPVGNRRRVARIRLAGVPGTQVVTNEGCRTRSGDAPRRGMGPAGAGAGRAARRASQSIGQVGDTTAQQIPDQIRSVLKLGWLMRATVAVRQAIAADPDGPWAAHWNATQLNSRWPKLLSVTGRQP